MWTTVYVASGRDWTLEIEQKLKAEGFLVKTKLFALENGEELYEILGPKFEAKEIQLAMIELGIV